MKRSVIGLVVVLCVAAVYGLDMGGSGHESAHGSGHGSSHGGNQNHAKESSATPASAAATAADGGAIGRAYRQQISDLPVSGQGTVVKVLPDDTRGDRHQRFILRLASGQTLLVAHNIDIAPRLAGLAAGDRVAFKGIYEWNDRGGVLHWTHHDPSGRHPSGWLQLGNQTVR